MLYVEGFVNDCTYIRGVSYPLFRFRYDAVILICDLLFSTSHKFTFFLKVNHITVSLRARGSRCGTENIFCGVTLVSQPRFLFDKADRYLKGLRLGG